MVRSSHHLLLLLMGGIGGLALLQWPVLGLAALVPLTQVIRLLRDRGLHQQPTANSRCLVEQRYDWTQISQRFVGLIEDVAGKHASGRISP